MLCLQSQSAALSPLHYIKLDYAVSSLTPIENCQSHLLAIGDTKGYVTLSDLERCETVSNWKAHDFPCRSILPLTSSSSNHSTLLTQSPRQDVRLWDLSSQSLIRKLAISHTGFARCVELPGGLILVPGGGAGQLTVVDPRTEPGGIQRILAPNDNCGMVMSACCINNTVISVYESGHLALWPHIGAGNGLSKEPFVCERLEMPKDHSLVCVAAAPIGKSLPLTGNNDTSVITTANESVTHTIASSNSTRCYGDNGGSDCESHACHSLGEGDANVHRQFSVQAVIGTSGQPLIVRLNPSTGRLEQKVRGVSSSSGLASEGQATAEVRSDGRVLALGCWDGGLRLLSWPRMRPLACLRLHTATVECLSFCSRYVRLWNARKLLVSGSADGTVALWKVYDD